jgi:hypothetical protein
VPKAFVHKNHSYRTSRLLPHRVGDIFVAVPVDADIDGLDQFAQALGALQRFKLLFFRSKTITVMFVSQTYILPSWMATP